MMENKAKKRQKSRIASNVRNVKIIIVVIFLFFITTVVAFIVADITSSASENLARLYSMEAMGKFTVYINRDLVLVQKISHSKAVSAWFSDEDNQEKKAAAYNEMIELADFLHYTGLYFGICKSLNEYSIRNSTALENFLPFDVISPDIPFNNWFYNCINADTDYTLNIDIDKLSNTRRLWINHKVMDGTDVVGVFCSGLPFDEIAHDLFSHYDSKDVRGYIVDRNGIIQMSSQGYNLYAAEEARSLCDDPLFGHILSSYLENLGHFFHSPSEPELVKLNRGAYLSIAPIAGTDWLVITHFNSSSLFSVTEFLPLIITLLSAFVIYTVIVIILMRRLVLNPLVDLTESLPETESGSANIFGLARDDEIGDLARTIQRMRNSLLDAANERERLISIDQLTMIPNRRSFDERLPLEWERAARTKTSLSILMLDLDHFKRYNDKYGHLNGDKVLQTAAEVFSRELKRPTDFIVRWGGEEFAIILPGTDIQGATYLAESIRKSLEDREILLDNGKTTKITVSIGVNTYIPSSENSQIDFIRQADDALYKAKKEGRNRVCQYTS